jgi:hypothetical protein
MLMDIDTAGETQKYQRSRKEMRIGGILLRTMDAT